MEIINFNPFIVGRKALIFDTVNESIECNNILRILSNKIFHKPSALAHFPIPWVDLILIVILKKRSMNSVMSTNFHLKIYIDNK